MIIIIVIIIFIICLQIHITLTDIIKSVKNIQIFKVFCAYG
jgi:hypothetical protein